MNTTPSDPYGFCEAVVREGDRDAWLASLFAPSAVRPSLHALDAFRIEIGHVHGRVSQPMAGEIRLQWWGDAIRGEAWGDAGANPLAAAVTDTIRRHALSPEVFEAAIEAHRIALYAEPMPSVAALEDHLDATTGGFIHLAATVLTGAPGDPAPARQAGVALGLCAMLQSLPEDAPRGAAMIPAEVLTRHGARPADVTTGAATPAIGAALAELRALARAEAAAVAADRARVPEAAAPAFLRLALVEPALRLLERPGLDPFAPPPLLPPWRRQWILWRAARRGRVI